MADATLMEIALCLNVVQRIKNKILCAPPISISTEIALLAVYSILLCAPIHSLKLCLEYKNSLKEKLIA